MAKTDTPTATAPDALPAITEVESLPAAKGGRTPLSDAEMAYARDVRGRLDGGKIISAGGFAERKLASSSAGRVKRLLRRAFADWPADGRVARFSVSGGESAYAWYATLVDAPVVPSDEQA